MFGLAGRMAISGVKNIDTYRKILKKSGEYFVQIFRHSKRKFRDFCCEKLYEKQEIILRKFRNNLEKL